MSTKIIGHITRISGPIVYAEGLSSCGLYDVVDVGKKALIGEIIRLQNGIATIQVYEDDTGMKIGEEVVSYKRPLSVRLGPGLIGTIYDGIQRPLKTLYETTCGFLTPGVRTEPIDDKKKWHFVPAKQYDGTVFEKGSSIAPCMIIGTVKETESVEHKIMVPPFIRGRLLQDFAGEGDYTIDELIGKTELDEPLYLSHYWPVRKPRPFLQKLTVSEPLITGQRVIDVFFPLSKGGTAAIPGGFGTGKTMTQHAVAKWCDADIIVYIGCGERGNEMTDVLTEFPELIDPRTNRSLMERTILIANTSNMPVAAREVSLYSGITLAEYYRDMGMDVAIMADSTSRWAEALRELSGRMEEMPAEEGFPAYLPTRLAEFYERAGRIQTLNRDYGSVSVIGAVSPAGGDISEPVTQATLRIVKVFWRLDADLARARHFPAINWLESYSLYDKLDAWYNKNVNENWQVIKQRIMTLLQDEATLQEMVRLVGEDALSAPDRLKIEAARSVREDLLQQNAFMEEDTYASPYKQYKLMSLIMSFYDICSEALAKGADINKLVAMEVREPIGRFKYTDESKVDERYAEIERALMQEAEAVASAKDDI